MADTKLVLCDAVCFVKSKFGKLLSNTLKVTLSDFYSCDVLAIAKQQLLDDILDMKSSVKFPHVPRRRDGDNRAAREIDDIISLFTCIDENKLFDRLPVYVSNNPDAMPSARLYEGDLYGRPILRLLNNLNDKVNDYGATLAILSRDLQAVQSRILPVAVQSSQQPRQQPQSQVMCHQPQHGPQSLSEFPTIE